MGEDAAPRRRVKPGALATAAILAALLAACDRAAGRVDSAAGEAVARPAPYDADSAARGLLAPEIAGLLAVDTLLDDRWLAANGGRCRDERLPQWKQIRRTIQAPLKSGRVTVFTRRTQAGEVRRIEIMHRTGVRPLAALSWDAAKEETVLTEWPQPGPGPIRRTTMRDPDAPIVAGIRYVGRRANELRCTAAGRPGAPPVR